MNDDDAIHSIHKKIEREKALINAANSMRAQTNNEAVRSRLDSQMRDGRRNLQFFEEKLRDIQMRRVNAGVGDMSLGGPSDEAGGPPAPPPKDSREDRGSDLMPPRHPYAPGPPGGTALPKPRQNFTKLDLIKYDTPHLGPRIQLMLSQIQFKLNVEEQYLKGIEKMVQLYGMEGDRKSKADAAARKVESKQKIILLKQALKRYEELHIDADVADAQDGELALQHFLLRRHIDKAADDSINAPNLRKPLSGQLSIRMLAIKDVDHLATGRFTRGPETFIAVKVEDTVMARTKATRNDRWEAEYHTIEVDKANEIELTVYDKPAEHAMPIAMLWVRISDIVEEMRRKRIEAEMNSSGWVSADRMGSTGGAPSQFPMSPSSGSFGPGSPAGGGAQGTETGPFGTAGPQPQVQTGPIEEWFNLEPTGQIQLQLAFNKTNANSRPVDLGLGRKGAVRQRKEEVHEMYGHKFVQHQFYNIMRCALCGDFLKYSAGMQCEDCKYTCHTKCYSSVVTKCISKSNAETDPDEEKINHRIPHRFNPYSNMTANWCCHCGYILPFGKKNCRKCSECNLTAHAHGGYDQQQEDPYAQGGQYGAGQQRKYNPADYANVNPSYGGQPPAQAQRPVQQQPAAQQPPPQQPLPPVPQHQPQQQQAGYQQPSVPAHQPQSPEAMSPKQQSASGGNKAPLPLATDPGTGQRIGLDHFNFLAVLGKGNFGKVMLAETKRSRKLYAIKVLKKEFIIENDEVESIRSEKRVFLVANRGRHPFLTNLHACFQTETRVYFVMEYVSGGDLMLHIQRGQFGTKRAQFYAAEVCLALKYFHENGVIYRDLKLDNILLSLDGHVKIGDYGLCKEDMWYGSTTSTFCGTPEFMAPEILLDKKYGRAVDWWAFGVLIYQMLLQQSPFRGEDEDEIYDAILADEPLYPIHMPRDSVSILQKLLTREPDQRLGSGPTDAQEIMSQPFFRNINWDDIYHKRVQPPFMPQIKSATDTSNFDSEFTSVTPVLTPVQSVLSQAMQEEFRGFSYTADFD
ncbi:putative protein kinase C-like [Fusarium fujikuroi]|nr:putative protein kinase C-like [Fusarium fujikuroi]